MSSALSVASRFGVLASRRLASPVHQSRERRGAHADAMISLASASTLRLDAAARCRNKAWISSGSFRIVRIDAIATP